MSDDAWLFTQLRTKLETEIEGYVYYVPQGSIGRPSSQDRVLANLQEMRKALVDPYWAEIELRDTYNQIRSEKSMKQKCAVVADDCHGYVLLWDPSNSEFLLAQRIEGLLFSVGIRGDAVGCFLSR